MTIKIDKEKIVAEVTRLLNPIVIINAAFIYGSFLEGESHQDIDIGLFVGKDLHGLEKSDFEYEIEKMLSKNIQEENFDVRVVNDAPDIFLLRVFQGKCLLIRDNMIEEKLEQVIRKCLDEEFYRDSYYKQAYEAN